MCFRRRLFRIWPLSGRSGLMCFGFGVVKIRDRIQTIPFKKFPRPPGALSTVGPLFRTSNLFFWEPYMTIWLPVIPVSTRDLPDSWYVPDLLPLISNRNTPLHQYVPQCRESAPEVPENSIPGAFGWLSKLWSLLGSLF